MLNKLQQGWRQPGVLNWLLLPVSWWYGGLMRLRQWAYQRGLCRQHELAAAVVVVGNLSVGGTGKTPLVIAIVDYLQSQAMQPGILARGYGGNSDFWPRVVTAADTAEVVGDEPLMLHRITGVPVAVGPQRARSGQLLIDQYGCDVLVSDDGFQHQALARDIDIVVIDGERGFGNGWCLPAGPLREPASALRRADMIVVNSIAGESDYSGYAMHMVADKLVALNAATAITVRQFADTQTAGGGKTYAVAGVGNPARFFNALAAGGIGAEQRVFADHHQYIAADFAFLKPADRVIITSKDAVKCERLLAAYTVWVLTAHAELPPDFFNALRAQLSMLTPS